MTDIAVISVIALVLLVVLLIQTLSSKRTRRSVDRLAEKSGLAITEEALPLLMRWRRSTWLGYDIGVPVGMEIGAFVATGVQGAMDSVDYSLLPNACWLFGGGIGALVGGMIGARTALPAGPRVARDRRVGVHDYVDPVERRAALGVAAVGLLMGLLPAATGSSEAVTPAVAGAVAVLAVGSTSLIARRIVAAPQRVASSNLLAWDDALRAATARTLFQAGAAIALYSLTFSLPVTIHAVGVPGSQSDLRLNTLLGISALLLAGMIWSMRQSPARYFLRRLWPETAAAAARNEHVGSEVRS